MIFDLAPRRKNRLKIFLGVLARDIYRDICA